MSNHKPKSNNPIPKSDIPNLHIHPPSGIWRYRHPITKKFHYLSRNYEECARAAEKLNARLMQPPSLVDKVLKAK